MRLRLVRTFAHLVCVYILLISHVVMATTYSDAESGNDGWFIYDQTPPGASIRVVYDSAGQSQVIETQGAGRSNRYLLGDLNAGSGWNNRDEFLFEWKMATDEPFVVEIHVDTAAGARRLSYNSSNSSLLKNPFNNSIWYGLGSSVTDGVWRTHQRDLAEDVAVGEPGNSLLGVNGVMILGSLRIDDVVLVDGNTEPPGPPSSVISSNRTTGVAPLTVSFNGASSSSVPPATLTGYAWNFGNGDTADTPSQTVTFTDPGTYTVALTVTDSNNLTDTISTTITVVEDEDPILPPTSDITSNVTTGDAPLTVVFSGAGSRAVAPAVLTRYAWDFGNGDVADTPSQTITFVNPGNYAVTLRVTDSNNLTGTSATTITVTDDDDPGGVPDAAAAARLLTQATFGTTMSGIDAVRSLGIEGWIDDQFRRQGPSHLTYARNHPGSGSLTGPRQHIWLIDAIEGQDQLRQRIAFAYSEIFVASDVTQTLRREQYAITNYYDMLRNNAFGNFRDLLEDVTLSPVMGLYLSMLQNARADPASNTRADENFAREVMQLFSVGLYELNNDGTIRRDQGTGQPIPAYTQEDVEEYARVFTGWNYSDADRWNRAPADGFTNKLTPMTPFPGFHDSGQKQLLRGIVSPAGLSAEQDLDVALDSLFNHPNVGPFIGKQLIQRLVTSNPSNSYVGRVALVFNNNGAGVRGDMRAVIRAILLDPEARSGHRQYPNYGKLREPLIRWTNLWRAFNVQRGDRSQNNQFNHGSPYIYTAADFLGQSVLSASSVFNFFHPDYAPLGPIRDASLLAPEAEIYTDANILTTTSRLSRFSQIHYQGANQNSRNTSYINISEETALASSPSELLSRLDLLLLSGQMSSGLRNILINHMSTLPGDEAGRSQRVRDCITLIMASPEYLVQK